MADITDEKCGNCGADGLLFCSNEFLDYLCKTCGARNLHACLDKVETKIPCKEEGMRHDIRIAKGGKIFCPICFTELGVMK